MSPLAEKRLTVDDYFALELSSDTRHEFFDGEIYAMAGGSRNHNAIQVNLTTAVVSRIRGGPCRFHLGETRVRVVANGLYTYPDASDVCGDPLYDERADVETVLNPKVILEILSPTTEGYDRGKKFKLYSQIEPLTDYILIAQDEPWVQHYTRLEGGDWKLSQAISLEESVSIPSISCDLPMSEIYLDVEFPDATPLHPQAEASREPGG